MSPQSRANFSETTTFEPNGDGHGWSCNPCSSPSSVAEIAWAANTAYFSLHKIESAASQVERPFANPLNQDNTSGGRKRSSPRLSSTFDEHSQPFLSSYGSAFLSGIFADIAEASEHPEEPDVLDEHKNTINPRVSKCAHFVESYLPPSKKSRSSDPTASIGGPTKSFLALAKLVTKGASSSTKASPPLLPVVSPRPNQSSINEQLFHDQVRELQNLAFPSLPHIPVTVSSSSCSSDEINAQAVTPRVPDQAERESSSYGWFISTDDDAFVDKQEALSTSIYTSNSSPDLAFKAFTAPNAENQDLEVQQALAADTIDDVLGDFF